METATATTYSYIYGYQLAQCWFSGCLASQLASRFLASSIPSSLDVYLMCVCNFNVLTLLQLVKKNAELVVLQDANQVMTSMMEKQSSLESHLSNHQTLAVS